MRDFLLSVLLHVASEDIVNALISHLVDPACAEMEVKALDRLSELFWPYEKIYPITLRSDFEQKVEDAEYENLDSAESSDRQAGMKAWCKAKVYYELCVFSL